ncbi:MAG: hypothetical protein ACOC56_06200 [Atribacterota bacterium]
MTISIEKPIYHFDLLLKNKNLKLNLNIVKRKNINCAINVHLWEDINNLPIISPSSCFCQTNSSFFKLKNKTLISKIIFKNEEYFNYIEKEGLVFRLLFGKWNNLIVLILNVDNDIYKNPFQVLWKEYNVR